MVLSKRKKKLRAATRDRQNVAYINNNNLLMGSETILNNVMLYCSKVGLLITEENDSRKLAI